MNRKAEPRNTPLDSNILSDLSEVDSDAKFGTAIKLNQLENEIKSSAIGDPNTLVNAIYKIASSPDAKLRRQLYTAESAADYNKVMTIIKAQLCIVIDLLECDDPDTDRNINLAIKHLKKLEEILDA